MGIGTTLAHAWNAFLDRPDNRPVTGGLDYGQSYSQIPIRQKFGISSDRSIQASIYTRMSIDCSSVDMRHVRLDEKDRYAADMSTTGLYNCLTLEANIDQGSRAFFQELYQTLFHVGYLAVVPVDTSVSPEGSGSVDIQTMRIGQIVDWYPQHVRIDLLNDQTGRHEQITLHKRAVGIVYNPFYSVMNEPNSTLQRLTRTLNLMDLAGEQQASGKLDMIIQLPYTIKSDVRREQANQRRVDMEAQLAGSKYGIAYADAAEKITQLNRPVENSFANQATMLMELLYSQLGLTPGIMDGTADEATMINYTNRTTEPCVGTVAQEFKRKFLSKTARTQKQSIEYFLDPLKLIPMSQFAEIIDKLARNEVISSNEGRQFLGLPPSTDPKADELRNSNMPQASDPPNVVVPGEVVDTATKVRPIATPVHPPDGSESR